MRVRLNKDRRIITISEDVVTCTNCHRSHPLMQYIDTFYSYNSPFCPQCKVMKQTQKELADYEERITDFN